MATDIRDRIIIGRYVGTVIECLSTEVFGYQRKVEPIRHAAKKVAKHS